MSTNADTIRAALTDHVAPALGDVYAARVALDALLAEVEQLRAALSEVEWNGYAYIGLEPCPCCGNERSKGHHTDDCLVGRAVRG